MTTKNEVTQLKFLQSQMQYYSSHLSLADMKAAGIMAFSVAISGVTADRMEWDGTPALLSEAGFAWLGLLFSLVAMICAFRALWPRYHSVKPAYGLFGWVDVSGNARSKGGRKRSHSQRTKAASAGAILDGMAGTAEDLAVVIAEKYRWIKWATRNLAPATFTHIAFWVAA